MEDRAERKRKREHAPLLPKGAAKGLDELELVVKTYKTRFASQCSSCCLAGLFWPVLLVLTPFLLIGKSQRDAAHRILLVLAVGTLSLVYFGPPMVIIAMRGPTHFLDLVRFGQVEASEILSYCVFFFILLVLLCYAWVLFESISLEVALSLQARSKFLTTYWREPVDLTEAQSKTIFGNTEPRYINDLINVLSEYPGWRGHFNFDKAELAAITSARDHGKHDARSPSRTSMPVASENLPVSELPADAEKASALRDQQAQFQGEHDEATGFSKDGFSKEHVRAITQKVKLFLRWLLGHSSISNVDFGALLLIGFLRACIPRFWVSYHHGAPLLPQHGVDAVFVAIMFLGTFAVASLCFILLESTRVEYAHNVDQMLLVSALASVESRHQYLHDVMQADMNTEEGRRAASRLPFLDLTRSANLRIWWALREFAIVDSMDERVALEVVLSLALLYMFVIILYSLVELFVAGGVTAFTAVVLFDLTVLGGMVMLGTLSCVQVNNMLSSHGSALLRSRQHIWSPESKIVDLSVAEQLEFVTSDQAQTVAELEQQENTLRLHNHLILKVRTADNLQKLFGIEVTTDNVIQLAAAIGCGIAASARYFT